MPQHEPFSDDEKLEADLLAEEFTGKPVDHGSTVKAIAALEKRLAYLRNHVAQAVAEPKALAREIRTAETQLAAYRQQLDGRN